MKHKLLAAAIVAGGIAMTSGGASAMMAGPLPSLVAESGLYEPVAHRKKRRIRSNDGETMRYKRRNSRRYIENDEINLYGYDNQPGWADRGDYSNRRAYNGRRQGQRYRYRHRRHGYGYNYGDYYDGTPGFSIRIN
ncbi:MAG: hypothetical protein ACKVP5_12435 [Aestuariivirga sp.]